MPVVHAESMTPQESLQFHIHSNDLFGTLATEIDLLRQDAEAHGYTRRHGQALRRLRDDLVYLQRGFCIIQRFPEDASSNAPPVQKTPQPRVVR